MVDSTRQFVFVLSETKPLPIVLTIFNAQGEKLFWSASPESAIFYYLTLNQSKEVVVVCNFTVIQNGWHNWFYSWDMKRNALSNQDLRTKFTFNIKITATRVPETGVRKGGIPAKGKRLA
ncbi:hypothetical protein WIC21_13300 [Enterobacter hormaechei]|uniref:hypothetical protein n=2 Tax=Enterobacter hormaechei TaxID=158836 RepID=UPI00339C05CB